MEGARFIVSKDKNKFEYSYDYSKMNTKELNKKLQELEEKMLNHAQNLEFEQAAHLRDEIAKVKEAFIEVL